MAEDERGHLGFVDVRLWAADAVVLFDWLMQADLEQLAFDHPSQRQALAALLGGLGNVLDVPSRAQLDDARAQVSP
ncbi:MAG: hypothetical protein ACRD2C_22045 [Acidimicrobiales bacterium]